MEHAFILCHHNIITVDHLPLAFKDVMGTKSFLSKDLRPDESNIILRALEQSAWNKARAARLLGMSRRTIYRKMKEYNIGLQDK